ncbi:MAG: hypothetical protein QXL51_00140 [Candidatus Aenigmatarchaeota archaeon]
MKVVDLRKLSILPEEIDLKEVIQSFSVEIGDNGRKLLKIGSLYYSMDKLSDLVVIKEKEIKKMKELVKNYNKFIRFVMKLYKRRMIGF